MEVEMTLVEQEERRDMWLQDSSHNKSIRTIITRAGAILFKK